MRENKRGRMIAHPSSREFLMRERLLGLRHFLHYLGDSHRLGGQLFVKGEFVFDLRLGGVKYYFAALRIQAGDGLETALG